jgi:Flp pilus assembly pilin Flp
MRSHRQPTYIIDSFRNFRIWIRESPRGQTFAEYALIFASLSLAVFAAYKTIGQSAVVLGNGLNSDLTSARAAAPLLSRTVARSLAVLFNFN